VDAKGHRYLVSVSKPPQLAIIDAEKLEVTGTVPLAGPADLLAFNEKTQTAYVGHDDGEHLWVVSPAEKKVVGTVNLPSDSPEDLAFDDPNEHLFQALKTAGTMAVIEVATNKVIANWSTAPAKAPHGIARIRAIHALAIAGGNGKLVLMDERSGKVAASADLPERVDQIAYDADLHHLYCASALGKIAVFEIQEDRLVSLGEVSSSAGAKSIALDPKTHTLWVAYVKDGVSIVQPFSTSGK
jgi:DNA-binding beta-propeller fold protein YncE